ncbi:phage SPO1 DNA polymerase-like protein [Candidatus Nitrosoglobus terrae]|uniref:Type-4 uracil-DNA glycosylase n=1 Tax=Candidatus Nitrosoglobus terrae TaxID=1630141 RepID=A0A1Q2SP13_9GAMM|nr:uracil-DNA glycosylase [Candidatus Nitrosoglobus terrae]BAW80895.1 phage SPO1 DNA polymerase-like protein [Candidatus Nitrosoglobus terrae]
MDPRYLRYLGVMEIQVWQRREIAAIVTKTSTVEIATAISTEVLTHHFSAEKWEKLIARVAHCTACSLHQTRTQTVFGTGDQEAKWLIVGEAPGADEDRQGEPFVGRAGKLLDAMLKALEIQRSQVYIANILKCRPPNNRDPLPEEVASCKIHFIDQILLLRPRIILALGRVAAQNLLKTSETLKDLRGKVHQYSDTAIPLIVTYHPAYLLRSPREKQKAWQDLQLAVKTYHEV